MARKFEKTIYKTELLGMRIDCKCPKCGANLKNVEVELSPYRHENTYIDDYGISRRPLKNLDLFSDECEICGTESYVSVNVRCKICSHPFEVILYNSLM
jgi:hypothetical protein